MEASKIMVGSSQVNLNEQVGVFYSVGKNLLKKNSKKWSGERSIITLMPSRSSSSVGVSLKACGNGNAEALVSSETSSSNRSKKVDSSVRLFVGLPLDAVSDSNTINHARAIATGLKALKLMGVDGVELPIWWGVVEKQSMGEYEWTGYLALAEMVKKFDLKLHVSLCFHASKRPNVPLPGWVSRIGESDPSIFFTDRSGQQYKDCLSFAVDELPVLHGKTPVQVYKEFLESFKDAFSDLMCSTITGVSVGLGPEGELRYPSHHEPAKNNNHLGAGEFQCYDKYMLSHLKQQAESYGNPLWGLSGPHDAPGYNEPPMASSFFKDQGGSWETPYGDFFLSWYSSQLISHGDRLLSLASSTFTDIPVTGKVPLMHSWYRTRAHPSELTAGFYNTVNREGYKAVAETFSRYSCKIILPGMDLSDDHQQRELLSSPELLLEQIKSCCRNHGVELSGQNSLANSPGGFEQIKKNLSREDAVVDLFTYQRMGADFFSPEHFPSFTEFVRSLREQESHSDDMPRMERGTSPALTGANIHTQTA